MCQAHFTRGRKFNLMKVHLKEKEIERVRGRREFFQRSSFNLITFLFEKKTNENL